MPLYIPSKVAGATATSATATDPIPITAAFTQFSTVASGATCILTAADFPVQIANDGANNLNVLPWGGANFEGEAVNVAVYIAPGGAATFTRIATADANNTIRIT